MPTILTAPTVTLLSKPDFTEPAHLPCQWEGEAEPAERLAEYAGRICYLSYANPAHRTTQEYLDNILLHGHGSVLEHAVFVVLIEGISRTCSHELVRHRAGIGFSQVSQRYVDSSQVAFVLPPSYADSPELVRHFQESAGESLTNYDVAYQALEAKYAATISDRVHRRKVAREGARAMLLHSAETKLVMSGNVRAWRHVLEMRGSAGADREIRRLAGAIWPVLHTAAPRFFGDFQVVPTDDGTPSLVPTYHKV